MKILFGIPVKVHHEITYAEVLSFQEAGAEVETSDYANSGEAKGIIGGFFLIIKNAFKLNKKALIQKSEILFLNTTFTHKSLVRDSITIFIVKTFNNHIKVVLKTHGTIESIILSKKNIFKKYLFKKVNLFLVLSKEEVDTFLKAGMTSSKVKVTANAIDRYLYKPDKDFRSKLGINEGTIILLFVGRFIEQKGILDIINACKILRESSLEFKLFCLGDGILLNKAKSLIKEFNLQDFIKLLGLIPESETRFYYSNCDILILPSYREGFPMAVFQAVAAGKSIITTKVNASADYLKEYENCLWVRKNNPADICEKVIILSKDKNLRLNIQKNNLLIANNFTSENIVGTLKIYLQELLN